MTTIHNRLTDVPLGARITGPGFTGNVLTTKTLFPLAGHPPVRQATEYFLIEMSGGQMLLYILEREKGKLAWFYLKERPDVELDDMPMTSTKFAGAQENHFSFPFNGDDYVAQDAGGLEAETVLGNADDSFIRDGGQGFYFLFWNPQTQGAGLFTKPIFKGGVRQTLFLGQRFPSIEGSEITVVA
jgi:hypothetical protein